MDDREQEKPVTPPPPQAPPFISLVTDAIQDEYKSFQNHLLPLVERVRAGHRFLSVAAYELSNNGEKDFAVKVLRFVRAYVPPRARYSVALSASDIPVRRVTVGGSTEFYSDFPLTDDARMNQQMVEDQRHEEYYNKDLTPRVAYVMVKLAEHKIIRETPRQLAPTFVHLTAPIKGIEEEEAEEAEEEEEEEDEHAATEES